MRFLDTNILLYASSTAPEEQPKALTALALLDSDDLALSVQVLQEFYVQATRPSKPDRMSHDQARLLIESFLRFPVIETTLPLVTAALDAKERYQISYWDAVIIEAARALGCQQVITEDLNDGQEFDGVVIVNPFREI